MPVPPDTNGTPLLEAQALTKHFTVRRGALGWATGLVRAVDAVSFTIEAGTTVRVGWRKDPQALNKRRADTIALLQDSCNQAGFDVRDSGTADFFENAWPSGNFDVAMFAWSGSSLVSGNTSIYKTGGGQNPGKYSNKSVDDALVALNQELDPDKQTVLLKQMDTTMWEDLATIPLFAFPGVVATSKNAEGVVYNPTQADLSWNAQVWAIKS